MITEQQQDAQQTLLQAGALLFTCQAEETLSDARMHKDIRDLELATWYHGQVAKSRAFHAGIARGDIRSVKSVRARYRSQGLK